MLHHAENMSNSDAACAFYKSVHFDLLGPKAQTLEMKGLRVKGGGDIICIYIVYTYMYSNNLCI